MQRRMYAMRTVDFSPLYRSAVGFDRLASLLETAASAEGPSGYPPYNVELLGDGETGGEALRVTGAASDGF